MVETRAYRDGRKVAEGFGIDELSERRSGPDEDRTGDVLWIDLAPDDADALAALASELGLHPLAVEDVAERGQRVKLDRYPDHLFLSVYALSSASKNHGFAAHDLTAFVLPDVLVTVRDPADFDMTRVLSAWDSHPDLMREGVSALLWAVLDAVVDSHLAAAQHLDERLEKAEETIFTVGHDERRAQRATYHAHKDVGALRRYALPMRDVLDTLLRGEDPVVEVGASALAPYYRDVNDHVLRLMGWTDALRDVATTLLDANLTVQSNRMNLVMKKVTSWAAIIAVPTLVTGVYGMNVQYPLFGTVLGWWIGAALVAVPPVFLYSAFKKSDWL